MNFKKPLMIISEAEYKKVILSLPLVPCAGPESLHPSILHQLSIHPSVCLKKTYIKAVQQEKKKTFGVRKGRGQDWHILPSHSITFLDCCHFDSLPVISQICQWWLFFWSLSQTRVLLWSPVSPWKLSKILTKTLTDRQIWTPDLCYLLQTTFTIVKLTRGHQPLIVTCLSFPLPVYDISQASVITHCCHQARTNFTYKFL